MSRATENLDAFIAELPPHSAARLLFTERCAAFWALHRGFPKSLVARAFRITPTTVTHLARALERDATRYRDVAAEFRRRGAEYFGEIYWTDEHDTRIARFRVNAATPADKAKRFGPNANAASKEGLHETMSADQTIIFTFRVHWVDHEGWAFSEEQPTPFDAPGRFRTSSKAFAAALDAYGLERLIDPNAE